MGKRSNETITLGSGKLFCLEYDATKGIPDDTEIEVENNRLAYIKGGATLEYAPEFYSATDDLGYVKKQKLQSEEVKLTSGLMTWNGIVLKKLCATGRVTEDKKTGLRIIKIGGAKNDDGKSYILHFLHEDEVDGDLRVTIVGQNTAGFSLAFAADAETVVDAEFVALPKLDSDGTLVIIKEEIDIEA